MSDEELRRLERLAQAGDHEARAALDRARARAGQASFAIISDVHGNLEALTAVLRDIEGRGIQDVICLGDLTGFGPDPVECIDLVRSRCRLTLKGDFEDRITSPSEPNLHSSARESYDWLLGLLGPRRGSSGVARQRWEFLESLPVRHSDGTRLFVHGSPRDPTREYVNAMDLRFEPDKFRAIFALVDRLVFVGHTHQPCVITDELQSSTPSELIGARWSPDGARKAIVNVGSVGQPRDRDNRACYVTVSGDTIEWHRIEYDVATTVAKIRRLPPFPESYGLRLREGV